MREYELTIVIQPELSEEGAATVLSKLDELLESGGSTRLLCEDMGKRKLAYEIQRFHKGHYYMLSFLDEGKAIPELERTLRIEESVLRFLTVNVADEVSDVEARVAEAHERDLELQKRAAEKAARDAEEAKSRAEAEARRAAEALAAEAAAAAAAASRDEDEGETAKAADGDEDAPAAAGEASEAAADTATETATDTATDTAAEASPEEPAEPAAKEADDEAKKTEEVPV